MIITTGDILDKKYEILDVIFAFGTPENKMFKTNNPLEAFPKVSEELKMIAGDMHADAIVHACFDYRVAVRQGCGSNATVVEVFGYGTAVRFK